MTDEQLRSLRRRFQETGAEADERAYLHALARAGGRGREDLEVVARFGSAAAAEALGQAPLPPPRAMSLGATAFAQLFGGAWEPALVYLDLVLEDVAAAWLGRGAQYAETMTELRPMAEAVREWLDGGRTDEAALAALAWAHSAGAWAELIDGRFRAEGRALSHLTHALGGLGWACAPLWAPARSGLPHGPPVRPDGRRLSEDEARLERVLFAQREAYEAIKGLMYMDHPQVRMTDADYYARVEGAMAPFEASAAAGLTQWLLAGRPARRG